VRSESLVLYTLRFYVFQNPKTCLFNTFLPRRIRFYRTLPETGCMYLDEVWWGRWSTRRRRLREWLDSCDTLDVQTLVVDTASASVNDRPTSVLGQIALSE